MSPRFEDSEDSSNSLDRGKAKTDDTELDENCQRHEQFRDNIFEANEDNILSDALYVYDYINKVMGIEEENIIIFGRSIGSGPATHVASKRKPGCLLLMSAFKSIRAIAQD